MPLPRLCLPSIALHAVKDEHMQHTPDYWWLPCCVLSSSWQLCDMLLLHWTRIEQAAALRAVSLVARAAAAAGARPGGGRGRAAPARGRAALPGVWQRRQRRRPPAGRARAGGRRARAARACRRARLARRRRCRRCAVRGARACFLLWSASPICSPSLGCIRKACCAHSDAAAPVRARLRPPPSSAATPHLPRPCLRLALRKACMF